MNEKIKKNLRSLFTVIAILWIFVETTAYYTDLSKIAGVLVMWMIIMYSLKEKKENDDGQNKNNQNLGRS